jgi:hypothetical protein
VTAMDLFAAGSETTATTLSWAVLFMILHPEAQQKVHEEIDLVPGPGLTSLLFRRMEGQTEDLQPRGTTSLLGDKVHPWGATSPLVPKFAPSGDIKNRPLRRCLYVCTEYEN